MAADGTYLDPELVGGVVDGFVGREDGGELSDREGEVIRMITLGHSNREIAAQLRPSVKTYKARSMEELKVRTRTGTVEYAVRQGWLDVPGEDEVSPRVVARG